MRNPDCTAAREWRSAFFDHETVHDPAAQAHLARCEACAEWEQALDGLTGMVRTWSVSSPDVMSAAIAAFRRRAARPVNRQREVARVLLSLAGLLGIALSAVTLLGLASTAAVAGHLGQDLSGLQAAIALGFLLAAWQPERYGRGLLPVAAAAVFVLLPSAAHAASGAAELLAEAAHLPLLLGFVGLLLLFDRHAGSAVRRAAA